MAHNFHHTLLTLDSRLDEILRLNKLATFVRNHALLLAYLFIAGIIAYGYDLFSFSMRIDSEHHSFSYGPQGAWIAQGRWGMYLLSYLLIPDVVMPFIPTLIAITGCAIGALFLLLALSPRRGLADYLAGPLAIACPVLYFALYFTTLGYGVGVAFAVTSMGIYLLSRNTVAEFIFAVLCFTLGIGIYQAVLPLITCVFCLQQVSRILDSQETTWKAIAKNLQFFMLALIAAGLLNQLITLLSLRITHVGFDSAYISSFVHIEPTYTYFISTLQKTLSSAWAYYTGAKEYYLFDLNVLAILFIFTLSVTLLRILCAPSGAVVKFLGILFLVGALLAPVVVLMMNAGSMPPRTMLGIAYVLAGLVFFTARTSSKLVQLITSLLAVICFYNFSMINNRYSFSNQMTWQADRELSVQLLQRIHTAMNKLPTKTDPYVKLPLEVVGWLEYYESPIFIHREVIGSSFYTWGAGDAERIIRLMATMGVTDFRPATKQEKLSVVEAAQSMPSWPYDGSVDVVNGIIVIKLRNYNPNQLMWMCAAPDQSHPACLKYLPK